jgi:4-hydroxybenzoyl-CoA thioesterase
VAVDDDGRPIPVRRWEPRTATQHAAEDDAVRRISVRASIEAAMAKQSYTDAGTAPRTSLRFHVTPNEINAAGKVSGGTVMRWIDETAHLCASTWAQGPTVATYAGGIRFYSRLDLDDVVEVQARLLHTGRSSMHVSVHVRSGSPHSEERRLTTHCLLVFAALGEGGTVPVRRWAPVSAEDIALDAHAVELIALRTAPEFSQ